MNPVLETTSTTKRGGSLGSKPNEVPQRVVDRLEDELRVIELGPGETVPSTRMSTGDLVITLEGRTLLQFPHTQQPLAISLMEATALLTNRTVRVDRPGTSVRATRGGSAKIGIVPARIAIQLAADSPEFQRLLLAIVHRQASLYQRTTLVHAAPDLTTRVARVLAALNDDRSLGSRTNSVTIIPPLTCTDIADMLLQDPRSVGEVLDELSTSGALDWSGTVLQIGDRALLDRVAGLGSAA
jgi:hypothetical protein